MLKLFCIILVITIIILIRKRKIIKYKENFSLHNSCKTNETVSNSDLVCVSNNILKQYSGKYKKLNLSKNTNYPADNGFLLKRNGVSCSSKGDCDSLA